MNEKDLLEVDIHKVFFISKIIQIFMKALKEPNLINCGWHPRLQQCIQPQPRRG